MGVRVVVDGAVGFAATVDVTPAEAANLVRSAIETARVTARAGGGRVELAPEPSHGEVHVDEPVRDRSGHRARWPTRWPCSRSGAAGCWPTTRVIAT